MSADASKIRVVLTAPAVLLSATFVFGTICPLLTTDIFWVRLFDFPRIQLMVAGLVAAVLTLLSAWPRTPWRQAIVAVLVVGLALQAIRVYPFTRLATVEVPSASPDLDGRRLRFLACNVLQHNGEQHRVIEQVLAEDPDVVLLLEISPAWHRSLQRIRDRYPHRIEKPLDTTWGIGLYSKLPLGAEDVHYYVSRRRPAIRTTIALESGDRVMFIGLHPAPPGYETQDGDRLSSRPKDSTLLIAAREASAFEGPVVVSGDFNDAAWSRMTRQFKSISGLRDPRVGRGLFNTYDADSAFLRYPIDHFFLSRHFELIEIRRLPHVGSDHFPMLVEVILRPMGSTQG